MLSRCAKLIVVWQKPNGDIYHKFVSGHYSDYFVGFVNGYDHKVIYIIDDLHLPYKRPPFKMRFKRQLIYFIEKF